MSQNQQTASMSDNQSQPRYNRIVVKAGTTLLTGSTDRLDLEMMSSLVGQVARLQFAGRQMMIVSSGAVAVGRKILKGQQQGRDVPVRQVLAAVGQGRLLQAYEQLFDWHGIPVAQALLTRRDLSDRHGYLNIRNTLLGLLDAGVIPIINENDVVAVDELSGGEVFGDNDTLSAMVANIVDADLLVMLGEVEGLYTRDPHLDPDAKLIPKVERLNDEVGAMGGPSWSDMGRGGMATKLDAAKLATASGVDTVIAGGRTSNAIVRLADGETLGTHFPATTTRVESRKRWMLSHMDESDTIVVDQGAVRALVSHNRSLLPPGVVETLGEFRRGDIVSIVGPDREQIACGITNYDSQEIDKISQMRSTAINDTLGHHYGDEVVHRDNMVILS
ncbi:MAG: glutamate 5-kinase [SAR202 cluster bacterium]|nr:glutamate 5-kinase [SAR202 cluster bacterium]